MLLACLMLTSISGCQTSRASDFCKVAKPIRPSLMDTAETKRQVLEHDEKGRKLCGW